MGLEGQHRRRQAAGPGGLADAGKQGLVAEMHAIEIADGQHRGTGGRGFNAAQDEHGGSRNPSYAPGGARKKAEL